MIVTLHGTEGERILDLTHEQIEAIANNYFAKVTQRPERGMKFSVDAKRLNNALFEIPRTDEEQENARQIIVEALNQVKKNPEKYAKPFKTTTPCGFWPFITAGELAILAKEFGDHMADWVEQALEWAQRISNGESWQAVCNDADSNYYYRAVMWENGCVRMIGGARRVRDDSSATKMLKHDFKTDDYMGYTIPLVVMYE